MAWTRTVVVAIWMACLTFLFLGIGFAIPLWMSGETAYVDTNNAANSLKFEYYTGVWYSMACIEGRFSTCENKPIVPNLIEASGDSSPVQFSGETAERLAASIADTLAVTSEWTALQALATVTLCLAAIAVTILMCCRFSGIHSRGFFICACLILLTSGVCAIITIILAAVNLSEIFSFTSVTSAATFPWSILLYVIGAILAIATAVLLMVITYKWHRYGQYYDSGQYHTWHDDYGYGYGSSGSNVSKGRRKSNFNYAGPSRMTDSLDWDNKRRTADWSSTDRPYDGDYNDREYDNRRNGDRGYVDRRSDDRIYGDRAYHSRGNGDRVYGSHGNGDRGYDSRGNGDRSYDNRAYDRDSDRDYGRSRLHPSRALPPTERVLNGGDRTYAFDRGSERHYDRTNTSATRILDMETSPGSRETADPVYDRSRSLALTNFNVGQPPLGHIETPVDRFRSRLDSPAPVHKPYIISDRVASRDEFGRLDRTRPALEYKENTSFRSSLPRVHAKRWGRTNSLRAVDRRETPDPVNFVQPYNSAVRSRSDYVYRPFRY